MARPSDPLEILDRAAQVLAAHDRLADVARARVLVSTPLVLLIALLVAVLTSFGGSWQSGAGSVFAAFAIACVVGGILLERARVQLARSVAWQSRVYAATKRHIAARQGVAVDLNSEEWAALYQLTVDEWPVVVAHSRVLARHGVSRETKKGSES
jgi:hypothetical protein